MDKIFSRYICLFTILLTIFITAGCSWLANRTNSISTPKNGIEVTDALGRKVVVPEKVSRIACLYAMSGQITVMLDRGENIVAAVEGMKRDILLTKLAPNLKDASTPSAGGTINLEELLSLKPDVIFVNADMAKNAAEAEKLEKSKITYLVVDCSNIAEQQKTIAMIGQVVGNSEKAAKYNAYYQNITELVQKRLSQIAEKDRVRIYHSVNEPNRTDSPNTLPADWLNRAGALNVSLHEQAQLDGENKYFVSVEQIMLWNPEVILVNEAGVAEKIKKDPQWAALKAVKKGKVYQLPVGISRWGHPGSIETPLAILWTAKLLYPALFTDIDMVKETKIFYKDFFGLDLTDNMVAMVLKGKGMTGKRTQLSQ